MSWSAVQYVRFEAQRNRPIHDLLAQLPQDGVTNAIDIGCGPGNSTELLMARIPAAQVSGIDSASSMIDAARERVPGVTFTLADIAAWAEERGVDHDLIFANAALQWLPDHATLLPRLMARLRQGGRLAVQMPDNLAQPAHVLMREIAAQTPFTTLLADAANARSERHDADWYFRTLRAAGAEVDIWHTTYHHLLPGGADDVVDWFKGTGLRPFLDPLNPEQRTEYLDRYRTAVSQAYPAQPDGSVLLPFPRLFFVATLV